MSKVINKVKGIVKDIKTKKVIVIAETLDDKGYVGQRFQEWSHGKDFVKIAEEVAKANNLNVRVGYDNDKFVATII